MKIRAIERGESLADQVKSAIEQMLTSGTFEPGERLNEVSLAEQLGVSRAPVREATRTLVSEGLLVAVPTRGVFVRKLSDREVTEIYDVRALLTGLICARAAELRTDAELEELHQLVLEMEQTVAEGRVNDYYDANLRFHAAIGRIADHACALRVYDDLIRETHHLRRTIHNHGQTNPEHRAILDAIRARDTEAARLRGETHVLNGKQRWIQAMGL